MTAAKVQRTDDEHLFEEIIRLNLEVLTTAGLPDDQAKDLAEQLCSRFGEEYGGSDVYVPVGRFWRLRERYASIYRDFTGDNYRELAKKYHLTERWVQRIVAQFRALDFKDRQGRFFSE